MAFDGLTIASVVKELEDHLIGGRIYKIAQPEADELLVTIKTQNGQYRLLLSAGASLPLLYLTQNNKPSPMTAPNFCMVLRKHLQNGRIISITQPGLERIVHIHVEHLDEMGDLCHKKLIIEIMGKYSNIIFCDDQDMIIDSIKHISGLVSSVREVLPGRTYFVPDTQHKCDPLWTSREEFVQQLTEKPMLVHKALYMSYTGLSPILGQELCAEAFIDGDLPTAALSKEDMDKLYLAFSKMTETIKNGTFAPCIAYEGKKPVEFAAIPLTIFQKGQDTLKCFDSMSELLEAYYAEKNALTRIRQRSVDLRRVVQTALERNVKKYDLQRKQMKDTEKRDLYRVYGELIHTYGYSVEPGSRSFEAVNYYDGETITIPLDPDISVADNAKKYFDKYNKQKRTFEALTSLTAEVKEEIEHLESIAAALDIAIGEEDLVQIKEELIESGYIRRKGGNKKVKITSKPFHYISSDGYHMYVGKNNFQNDELTFKFATGNDWWFHAKGMPGSHVIVKLNGNEELPDRTFEEAARLAAHYSKGSAQDKVEIDYVQKKQVKKPSGAKPGFVVYYTNFSMAIDSDISDIRQCEG